jgi:hypothetical protein
VLGGNMTLYGQTISGTVFKTNSDMPIEYVHIGIVGKNIGTVSDQNGNYVLQVKPEHYNDSILFSCIGYDSFSVKVSDLMESENGNVSLDERFYHLTEVIVRPKRIRQKTLGITVRNRRAYSCFGDSIFGRELGVLMKNKGRAFLKEVNLNISTCTYDTVFYRINIYKAHGKMRFENILANPVYFASSKEEVKDRITVDLSPLNLVVDGNFLVSIENVKNLGTGSLCYHACTFYRSYLRSTSQGEWKTIPAGLSLSVKVDIEK